LVHKAVQSGSRLNPQTQKRSLLRTYRWRVLKRGVQQNKPREAGRSEPMNGLSIMKSLQRAMKSSFPAYLRLRSYGNLPREIMEDELFNLVDHNIGLYDLPRNLTVPNQ